MDIRAQAQFLFEKYNEYMIRAENSFLSSVPGTRDVYTEEFEREIGTYTDAESDAFFTKPLAGFAFDTPADFFASLQTLDEDLAVFSVAAEVSDVEPPRALTDRLAGFGQEATDRLLEMALAESWEGDGTGQEDIPASVPAAIRLLGKWGIESSIEPILRHFCSAKSPDEYMADVIGDYAEDMGDRIVPELRRILNETGSIPAGSAEESLLVALAKAGAKHRTEENYDALRASFRKAERKVIGALCLGDYGDPRAIALLKGYLDRNAHALDRETFYESMSVIRKLGGDISDINDPFGDFRRKQQ